MFEYVGKDALIGMMRLSYLKRNINLLYKKLDSNESIQKKPALIKQKEMKRTLIIINSLIRFSAHFGTPVNGVTHISSHSAG